MELFKTKTSYKSRRAREGAAAARFFDESVRNSYARRATTPQTALRRQGEFRAEARKRSRRCVTLMRTPVASVSGAQQNMPYVSEPLSRVKRNIRLTMEVRERFADRTTFCRRSAAVSRAEGKSKKTMQSGGTQSTPPRTSLS